MNMFQILCIGFTLAWIISIVMLRLNLKENNWDGVKSWNTIQIVFVVLLDLMALLNHMTSG